MELLTNKKFLWGIILMLLVVNVATITTIWLKDWNEVRPILRRSEIPAARDHFLNRELNFSLEQQTQFDTLLSRHRIQIHSKIDEIRTLREELMSMMRNQEFTAESEDIVRKIGEKQSELEMLNYDHFREVMAICDDDQKQIFLETLKRAVGPFRGEAGPGGRDDNFRRSGNRGRR